MAKENDYMPSSREAEQIIHKSILLTRNKALLDQPDDHAKKTHISNIQLLNLAAQRTTDPVCHARTMRTIAHLQSLIDAMDGRAPKVGALGDAEAVAEAETA